ncbi:DUF58 domain-containing protein [Halobacteriales archaeon QS_1_68_20]|nr:MAG: DUF58 domain-containing protein [Halobacteriales archaeon QS_1_68_20]
MTTVRETNRWRGITALALFGAAAGAVLSQPAVFLAGMVAIGYAAFARGAAPPEVDLAVEREVSTESPGVGDAVAVTTTVRNVGEATLPDLRVVDGVPEGLTVVDGVARTYTALAPGAEAAFEYVVEGTRGEHSFGEVTVFARDASGAVEVETTVQGPTTTITCVPTAESGETVSLGSVTDPYPGTVTSGVAGSGAEFHSVREYRPGDPLGHVDWRRLARTGDLSTIQFEAERMATVLLVIDARPRAFAETETGATTAVEHCVDAARQLLEGLLSSGNRVGVAALAPEITYLEPGLGRGHRVRAREFLAAEVPVAPSGEKFYPRHLDALRRRVRGDRQVFWLSPMLDDYAVSIAETFAIDGHAVTTVSPDVTTADSAGGLLARAERDLRLSSLRDADVRVIDWRPPAPLETAVAAAERGWRQ